MLPEERPGARPIAANRRLGEPSRAEEGRARDNLPAVRHDHHAFTRPAGEGRLEDNVDLGAGGQLRRVREFLGLGARVDALRDDPSARRIDR